MSAISPLAPQHFPQLAQIAGVRLAAIECGVRYKGRTDLMLAELPAGSTVAGTFTRSLTAGVPVVWDREILPGGKIRGIVVNSGNANVFTGRAGRAIVEATASAAAKCLGCSPREVFVSSTGVIGEQVPPDRIPASLPEAAKQLSNANWENAARAIMTTDTYPKGSTATATIDGVQVQLSGFAKGSGMIAPDMATMLCYIFTDAALPASVLQPMLSAAVTTSFNSITVDSDTSTSDTVLLCATQQAKHGAVSSHADRRLASFRRALRQVTTDLATQIAKDGEGAQKLITIDVTGAASARAARRIGLSIANSPLFKTMVAAGDPNWGRIVMAVGKAGEKADRDRLSIAIGGLPVAKDGVAVAGYDETPVKKHMDGRDVRIGVDIGIGRGKARVWTCDLTYMYLEINGAYRS
ncbi:MAG TPA: bifunctional glutamate N-acetyltransferase/amino-acid acetyltransferase ArgJ [Stellaceae bacterium]|nr:bifunctional glutamate N-acetyltransferase/amino-acid acetyltransferase ArgJ [Stellaceae bacterium]